MTSRRPGVGYTSAGVRRRVRGLTARVAFDLFSLQEHDYA